MARVLRSIGTVSRPPAKRQSFVQCRHRRPSNCSASARAAGESPAWSLATMEGDSNVSRSSSTSLRQRFGFLLRSKLAMMSSRPGIIHSPPLGSNDPLAASERVVPKGRQYGISLNGCYVATHFRVYRGGSSRVRRLAAQAASGRRRILYGSHDHGHQRRLSLRRRSSGIEARERQGNQQASHGLAFISRVDTLPTHAQGRRGFRHCPPPHSIACSVSRGSPPQAHSRRFVLPVHRFQAPDGAFPTFKFVPIHLRHLNLPLCPAAHSPRDPVSQVQ